MLSHRRPASETPLKWRFAGGPMMAHFSAIRILSLLTKKEKKTLSELNPLCQNSPDPRMQWLEMHKL